MTELEKIVTEAVTSALVTTIARKSADAGEKMAEEILANPEVKEKFTTLLSAAFDRALTAINKENS